MSEYREALATAALRASKGSGWRASPSGVDLSHGDANLNSSRTPRDEHATSSSTVNGGGDGPASHNQAPGRQQVPESELDTSFIRTITQPDWKGVLCYLLKIPPNSPQDVILCAVSKAEEDLRDAEHMRKLLTRKQEPPRPEIIHVVRCHNGNAPLVHYHDEPRCISSGPYHDHRQGSDPVRNLELFLEKNKEVTFLVYRTLECCKSGKTRDEGPPETISIVSPILRKALINMAEEALQDIPHPIPDPEDEEEGKELNFQYPYLWWYHRQREIWDVVENIYGDLRRHMDAFTGYLEKRMHNEWLIVRELIARGKVTAKYIGYLFEPGTIVVTGPQGKSNADLRAFQVTDWPITNQYGASLPLKCWVFDGNFQRNESMQKLHGPLFTTINPSQADEEFAITSLQLYPLSSDVEQVRETLKRRGNMFWRCRKRNYVSYRGLLQDDSQSADQRFMVDMTTYKKLHPSDNKKGPSQYRDDLGPTKMSLDNPPREHEFYMTMPSEIVGFNMQTKEWILLAVDQIEDVTWNSEAFSDYLVISPSTKELIQALVMEHLRAEESADVISGKGNGLFFLLHGAPGTGKTLTAESVAEVAQKPLYRVTCGDIGTRPEEVEEYLHIVFTLGRTWDCVVLLDEADVYLEQRSSSNLERNALVSVFLRALEYYDGIMILTSNRVGTFDEAFRSRIQPSLKYNKLDVWQRQKIWRNFINRLDNHNGSAALLSSSHGVATATGRVMVDTAEITLHINELARRELNGRQIRNIISTARKLATYRKQPLCYKHLQQVMEEADKFEEYIVGLRHGFTDDDLMYK